MAGTRESGDVGYRAMVDSFTADKRDRVIPSFGIRRKVIALDNALVNFEFKLQGDFIYCDLNSTGVAVCSLNSPSEDGFPLVALAGISDLPFDGIYVNSAAQPGLFINLWYGTRSRFVSPTSAIATIGSIVNPVSVKGPRALTGALVVTDQPALTRDIGYVAGSNYTSGAALGAGGTSQVFSAASNVNGAIVWLAQALTLTAGLSNLALLAKATAPTTITDGQMFYQATQITTGAWYQGPRMERARYIAPGLGLFWFSSLAETACLRYVDYTLL